MTTVSTKFDVVNLLGLEEEELSLGVLPPLPIFSSAFPFISKLGLALDLLFELDDDDDAFVFEFELLRLPLLVVFTGVSASFSGDESDEPLSAGIGL